MNSKLNILQLTILLLSMSASLIGCIDNESSGFSNIPAHGWVYGDTVYFTPAEHIRHHATDTIDSTAMSKCDVSIVVRHNNNYEYSNIWIEMKYATADSMATDTINLRLADDFGNWLGKGSGVSYQQSQKVLKGASISPYAPIKVTHIMRADTLANVEQIGVVVNYK